MDKIFLGKVSESFKGNERNYIAGENIYLTRHSWDCNWYYGFGYIGNKNLHTHFDITFLKSTECAKEIFINSKFTDNEWWIIRDLFIQAYALKKVAGVYHYGGHQTSRKNITDIIKSKEKEDQVNKDLKLILDTLWNFIQESIEGKQVEKDKKEKLKKEKLKLKEQQKKLKKEQKRIDNELKETII